MNNEPKMNVINFISALTLLILLETIRKEFGLLSLLFPIGLQDFLAFTLHIEQYFHSIKENQH